MDTFSDTFQAMYAREAAAGMNLPQPIQADYDATACLASAEHKEIYLLTQKSTGQLYVLKQRPCEQASINEAEYAMLKNLDHVGIPKAAGCLSINGYSYLIREYFEGNTLEQLIRVRGALSLGEIIDISLQLCGILQYLHEQAPPVIYRDLKPQNVILMKNGAVRLIDFDISRKYNPDAARDTVFMGTTTTAPPEQYGYTQTDVRSDIYSLGVMMVYLGSGQYDIHTAERLPLKLAGIVKKCTQFAPKDRYASMAQVRRRLLLLRQNVITKLKIAFAIACCLGLGFLGGLYYAVNTMVLPASAPQAAAQSKSMAPVTTQVSSEGVVTFASDLIEKNVRNQLGIKQNEPIYIGDLKKITTLCVMGDSDETGWDSARMEMGERIYIGSTLIQRGSIAELTDIPLFENLMHLELFGQQIVDISPLKDMKLFSLILGANFIRDLSPLAQMQMLKILKIGYNPVCDLTPLTKLTNLREIGFECTQVYDLTPLAGLKMLESVNLLQTSGMDYSPLALLPRLETLNISDTTLADVQAVIQNKNLRELHVHRCGITDVGIFDRLDKLELLTLWGNEIADISGVEKLENLSYLDLNCTGVADLLPLTQLKKLRELEIFEVRADLSPLLDIPTLRRIFCSADMREQVDKIKDKAKFTIEMSEPWSW